jgi:hypothetical protein
MSTNLREYRVDHAASQRREAIREFHEFCRRQQRRFAYRCDRHLDVITEARRISHREDDGGWQLEAYRRSY